MDRGNAASLMFSDRPLLGQMAIATVLVGSAAALSSAGIAVPVNHVGFDSGKDARAFTASSLLPATAPMQAPAEFKLPLPFVTNAAAPRITVAARIPRIGLIEPAKTKAAPVPQSQGLVVELAPKIAVVPGPQVVVPLPVEAPVAALAVPSAPLAAALAAPAGLAVSAPVAAPEISPLGDQAKLVPAAAPLRLVNPPELRGFDLARMGRSVKSVPAGIVKPNAKPASSGKLDSLSSKSTVVGDVIFHQLTVTVAGAGEKTVDVRIGGDMKPSLKVGDLLGLVSDRMDPDSAARFAAASSAGDYVSLATLRAAGFDVAYNAGADSISISVSQ